MPPTYYKQKISFEEWLVNLNEELEVPLNMLTTTLETLASAEEDGTKKEQLNWSTNLVQRFSGLMNNLNLAALEQTRKALLRIADTNLDDFVKNIVERFQQPQFSGVEIHFHSKEDVPSSYLDRERLYKVIATLISNAIQFAKEDRVRVDVTLKIKNDRFFQLVVQDDGIGIVAEKLPHLFDPLYDKDPIHLKLYQPTSAGLYLLLLYVKAMGGDIQVESEKMVYTRFTVTLPILKKSDEIPFKNFEIDETIVEPGLLSEQKLNHFQAYSAYQQEGFIQNTALVLAHDDLLRDLERFFTNEMRMMSTGDSALTIARALHLKPDLIILHDGNYGDISSDQVAKTLKNHDLTKKIPLVWISSRSKLNEADLNINDEIDPHLIFEKIEEFLHLRKKLLMNLLEEKSKPTHKSRYQSSKEAFLTRLERIVDAHLHRDDFGMDKLSEMLFLNRSQIHRKIKTYAGMNTTEYIRNYKLKLAYRDLERQSGNIAEIAYRNGFNSPSYFSKSFKEVYGIAPSTVLFKGENETIN